MPMTQEGSGRKKKRLVAMIPEEIHVVEGFQIDLNQYDREMRVVFTDEETGQAMARVMTSDEAYAFAQQILRGYDQLENIT